jgi:serine/threonine protein kinase/formylglycine-generating enzyme required for sulfatase activity
MSASESKSGLVLQLVGEFLERYRQGERPSLKEYIDRHPQLAAEIKEVFPAMALMENVALADESLAGVATGPATPTEATPPPQQLGDYRILREVGRGGMGIVYEAEQVSLGRHVALKVLPRKILVDDQQRRRFEREAKAAAKLHHTNIVPVFGVGEHAGMPYYVMQFIQGLGLDEVLEELKRMQGSGPATATGGELRVSRKDVSAADVARSLLTGKFEFGAGGVSPPSEPQEADAPRSGENSATGKLSDSFTLASATLKLPGSGGAVQSKDKRVSYWQSVAQIGRQVAEALEYAHKQGIQHRDIKPSNLLLDTRGTVWVTDFGLARADNEAHLTQTGDIVGTLRYMPPEAFECRWDKRGDIYSLGLTLYELLACKPAYEERDRHRLIKQVTTEEPARLDKRNRSIPRDLVTIVHKAIDREPGRRYATAGELAADLQRFLDDEPIRARRVSNAERLLRWGRRNKGFAFLSAVAIFLLVTVAVVSTLSALQLLTEQNRANKAERDTLSANVESLMTASPDSVPFILDTFKPRAGEVLSVLEKRAQLRGGEFVPRLRLNVALAVLGRDCHRELCAATADTPPAESFNLLLGLKSCDRETTVTQLWDLYQQAKDSEGRTRLAIALLELGNPHASQAELALKPNLTARVRFIHLFAAWHGSLSAIPDLLRTVDGTAFRGGLCLAVASMDRSRLSPSTLRALDEVVTQLYTNAPDGGTHGAAEYALRHRNLPLPAIAPTQGPVKGRRWFVNRQGMTLIAVESGWFHPVDYDRLPGPGGLPPQTVVLTQSFFMGDQEVTAEWYRWFLNSTDHPKSEELTDAARQADLQYSLARVNWRNAILFCNWLSRAEGRKPCYRPADPGLGMQCDFTANGYRLPTDAEWEHAYRCGTTTRFFVGEDVGRLLEYGRVFATGPGPGKCFFPNPHGLFDMLGNGWEMCWDQGINQFGTGLSINPVGPIGNRYAMRGGAAEAGLFYFHGSARIIKDANLLEAFRVACGPLNPEDAKDDKAITLSALNRFPERYAKSDPQLWTKRGRFHAELGQYTEAAADFTKAIQLRPDDPEMWKERGRSYFEVGQTDKAAADFRKAVQLLGDKAEPTKAAESEADMLFARLAADVLIKRLTTAIEGKPEDMEQRWRRGQLYAKHQRWKEGAADFTLALRRQQPIDAFQWLHVAPVLAAAGVRQGNGLGWPAGGSGRRRGSKQSMATLLRLCQGAGRLPPRELSHRHQ